MVNLEENNTYFYFNRDKLIHNFNIYNEYGKIYYPLKTNSNKIIIETLKDKFDNGFLISSISNFETLQQINIDISKICFINVLAEYDTIKYLYNKGVRFFTFDNLETLESFSKYADLTNTKIVVRVSTMQVFKNKYTHLGANIEETFKMLKYLKEKCNNYGISFYLQNNLKNYDNALELMLKYVVDNFSNLGLSFVNIGGIESSIINKKELIETFKRTLDIKEIILEIGKCLIEDTIDMETRIIKEKLIDNKKTIIIKNGIYSGFFDILLYNKKFDIYLKSKNDGEIKLEYEKSSLNDYEFIMCGGSSDSGDILGKMYINSMYKDELVEGAKLIIKNVGAYFEEFFMQYSNDLKKVYIEV